MKESKAFLRKCVKGNEVLVKKLEPEYRFGCKRVLVSETYYKTFTRPNVHLHREGIQKIEGREIRTKDGVSRKFDVSTIFLW